MRLFWIGIIVLIAATAAVFLIPADSPTEQADVIDTAAPAPTQTDPPGVPATPVETPPRPQSTPKPDQPEQTPPDSAQAEPVELETNPGSPIQPAEQPGFTPEPKPDRPAEPSPPSDMPSPNNAPERLNAGPGEPITHDDAPPPEGPDEAEPLVISPDPILPDTAEIPADDAAEDPVAEATDAARTVSEEPVSEKTAAEENVTKPESGETDRPTEMAAVVVPAEKPSESRPDPEPQPATAPPVAQTPEGLLLDGRWTIPGKGTADSPYVIQWDMLVAVKRDYEPRLGKDKIPEWIAALNGKRVSIEGYTLLPIGVSTMSELLIMLNQWDGCCIGVPPTPYDAVEVRLKNRLNANAGQMFAMGGAVAYGRITGTFEIDPYVAQGWLLGLYLINDAEANLYGPAGAP